jgi:hypothetical protein
VQGRGVRLVLEEPEEALFFRGRIGEQRQGLVTMTGEHYFVERRGLDSKQNKEKFR